MIEHSRTEQVILEMDKLANENHSFKVSKNEIEFYRGNWWLHSNVTRDETMPVRHEPGFKEALSTMQRLKRERKTRRSRKQHHNLLHPRLHGIGSPAGGSPTTSTRLKNGMTTKTTWGDPYEKWCITY